MPFNVTISGEREQELKIISRRLHMTPQQLVRHYVDKGLELAKAEHNKYWKDKIELAEQVSRIRAELSGESTEDGEIPYNGNPRIGI